MLVVCESKVKRQRFTRNNAQIYVYISVCLYNAYLSTMYVEIIVWPEVLM